MFDEEKIVRQLSNLSHEQRIVFGASCCERQLPSFVAFSQIEKWGNSQVLEDTLEGIWQLAVGNRWSDEEVQDLWEKCEMQIPDSEDFQSAFTFQAQNAVSSICYTLEYYKVREISLLGIVARSSYEAVEMFLSTINDPNLEVHAANSQFDNWILEAPLLIAELTKQANDIKSLSANSAITNPLIERIKYSSTISGVQPIKRGLIHIGVEVT